MLNYKDGRLIAKIKGGKKNGKLLYLNEKEIATGVNHIEVHDGKFIPLPDVDKREVVYIAGPSGSGKSTYSSEYINSFMNIFPDQELFIFSRTDAENDPAFINLDFNQVLIDESLIDNPIDITEELTDGCIILFDDVNTIQNEQLKKAVDKLMADIMECGRKLGIYCVITNHLIIPNERKVARTILNECTSLTVFPKSGAIQQIKYVLKTYFGYNNNQIENFLKTKSRWITFYKTYPQLVLTEYECYIPN